MANEQHRNRRRFGIPKQRRGTFAHLNDTPWRAVDGFALDGLDGIHDKQVGLNFVYLHQNLLQSVFAQHDNVVRHVFFYAIGAHFQLMRTLFATNVEYSLFGHSQNGLQH